MFNELVCKTAKECHEKICENLKDRKPKEHWLIHARIVNLLAHWIYEPVFGQEPNGGEK
jgi:hypothetical protein